MPPSSLGRARVSRSPAAWRARASRARRSRRERRAGRSSPRRRPAASAPSSVQPLGRRGRRPGGRCSGPCPPACRARGRSCCVAAVERVDPAPVGAHRPRQRDAAHLLVGLARVHDRLASQPAGPEVEAPGRRTSDRRLRLRIAQHVERRGRRARSRRRRGTRAARCACATPQGLACPARAGGSWSWSCVNSASTSVRPSAESPVVEPSYGGAGDAVVAARAAGVRSTTPPLRITRWMIVSRPAATAT